MPWKTIDCAECGATVPYGRLSCPSCGALLASVTGGRPTSVVEIAASPDLEPEPEREFIDVPVAAAMVEPVAVEPLAGPPPPSEPSSLDEPPVLAGRPYRSLPFDDSERRDLAAAPSASAYRPSGLVLSGAVAGGAGWSAPAASATATVTEAAEPATTSIRSRVGPVDHARFAEIAGWFVVVGATMTVLGFLLPWSVVVIGARGIGTYFDTWGLASPTHVVVLATTMLVLALGILRTAVPVWIRSGVLPLALGSLLIGLAWPYQVGPLGADVGILVIALGGLALMIGGIVTIWATRHVEVGPAV